MEKTKAEPKAKKEKVVKEKVAKEKKEKEKDVKEKGGKTGAGVANGGEKKEGGKEKVKAVSGEEAEKLIKEYLKIQNRPYSATEVSANLHGKVCLFKFFHSSILSSRLVSNFRTMHGGRRTSERSTKLTR